MSDIQITVWRDNGKYYSTIHQKGLKFLGKGQVEIFSVSSDIAPSRIEELREEARIWAREMGLPKVMNLDD